MILKRWKDMLIFLLIILLLLSLGKCVSNIKQSKLDKKNLKAITFELTEHKDKTGKIITEQQQLIVTKQSEINKLISKVDDLSNVTEQVKIVTKTFIKNIEVPIDRPIYITVEGNKYLKIPASFKRLDEWYGMNGSIRDSGNLKFDSLYFISKPTLTFGLSEWNWKKPFKKRVPMVAYSDENPYAKVMSMKNVKLNKVQSKLSVGIQCGYGVTKGGFGPYVGLGVGWRFF